MRAGRVGVRRHGPVLHVLLDRPEARNAQTPATWRALAAVGHHLPPEVRVVVLRGAGASFSAGLDRAMLGGGLPGEPGLAELATLDDAALDAAIAGFQRAFTWWRRPDVVTVAAVQGHAVGAGFQLALACDLRVVADDVRFAMRETSLGLVPDLGGTGPLVRAVGYPRALELCVTGRWVGAEEAVATGLAQLAVPVAALDGLVDDLVAALLAPDLDAVREETALLDGAEHRSERDQLAAERAAQGRRLRSLLAQRATGGKRAPGGGVAPPDQSEEQA
ncbi:enoyl-CoA hydratase/isomerase family protein [Angustibacter aerolatus]